jgi:hypothetical protein
MIPSGHVCCYARCVPAINSNDVRLLYLNRCLAHCSWVIMSALADRSGIKKCSPPARSGHKHY